MRGAGHSGRRKRAVSFRPGPRFPGSVRMTLQDSQARRVSELKPLPCNVRLSAWSNRRIEHQQYLRMGLMQVVHGSLDDGSQGSKLHAKQSHAYSYFCSLHNPVNLSSKALAGVGGMRLSDL